METLDVAKIERLYIGSLDFLKPLKTEEDYDRLNAAIDSFAAQGVGDGHPLMPLMEIMFDLVAEYENIRYPAEEIFERPSTLDVLQYLMEERGLKQRDLVPVFGSQGNVSQIFRKKRQINLRHIERLAVFFGVSRSTFLGSS